MKNEEAKRQVTPAVARAFQRLYQSKEIDWIKILSYQQIGAFEHDGSGEVKFRGAPLNKDAFDRAQ